MKIFLSPFMLQIMDQYDESFMNQWEEFTSSCSYPFLRKEYLLACIRNSEDNLKYYPVIGFEDNHPVFVFILQKKEIPLQSLAAYLKSSSFRGLSKLSCSRIEWLTLGHHLVSGEYGFYGDFNKIRHLLDYPFFYLLLKRFCSRFQISFLLIKDIPALYPSSTPCFYKNMIPIRTEPDMVIKFPNHVKNLEEYLACFSKKYRQRYKKVLEKGKELNFIPVSNAQELKPTSFYDFFLQVHEKASYKFVRPSREYFMELLGHENFYIERVLLKSMETGFLSYFVQGKTMWAHYIGLDYSVNREYEIYQNILLQFIRKAFDHGVHTLHLGRTAAEIKSCLGADPVYYHNYLVPGNLFSYWFIREISGMFSEKEWIKRNPFTGKKENEKIM